MIDTRRSSLVAASLVALTLVAGLAIARPPAAPTPADVQPGAQPAGQPAAAPAAEPAIDDSIFRPFGFREPLPRKPGTIRLATYNIENLFDDKDDPALSGANEDRDQTKPDENCKAVATAINAIDADVIALQEIESIESLKWFMDKYLPGSAYKYVSSIDAGDDRGIEQAVLSRFPITGAKNWPKADLEGVQPDVIGRRHNDLAGQPMKAHRSPLMVTIEVPASVLGETDKKGDRGPYELTLFVVHMKSGRDFGFWREAESKKVLSLVEATLRDKPQANIAVLGDFNATLDAASVGLLKAGGLNDLTPSDKADPVKPDKRFVTHSSGRSIDHLMVNGNLMKEIVPDSEFVLSTPTRPEGTDYRTTPTPPGYAADHFPVVVDLVPRD